MGFDFLDGFESGKIVAIPESASGAWIARLNLLSSSHEGEKMKRVHVIEFEDFNWFPSWLRTCMTNNIVIIARFMGVTTGLGNLVSRILNEEGIDRIVDLGSGGGGVMPDVLARVREMPRKENVQLTMTDFYPNADAVKKFNQPDTPHIEYLSTSVDATSLASTPEGLKTMSNCFHHMRPETARAILKSAHDNRQPLLIYEMGPNNVPFFAWVLSLPIALPMIAVTALVLSAFVRPVTFRQIFFTYFIPLIPIFYAWDGHASVPRIYTFDDMDDLLKGLDSPDYRWEKGLAQNHKGKDFGNYLLGLPTKTPQS